MEHECIIGVLWGFEEVVFVTLKDLLKHKELCPTGMWGRKFVYGIDREKFDAWDEIIDELDTIIAVYTKPDDFCSYGDRRAVDGEAEKAAL